jgi:hypothetical protein
MCSTPALFMIFLYGVFYIFAILYRSAHIYSENKRGTQDRIIESDTKGLKTTNKFQYIVLKLSLDRVIELDL